MCRPRVEFPLHTLLTQIPHMRERKPYPDVSDEELDRRAEEALKRMLANPNRQPHEHPRQGGQGQGQGQGPGQGGKRHRRQKRRPK